jgi:anti-sigma factor RsiW
MSNHHLSAFEQEEYVLGERTPEMLRHLAHCAECEADVARLQHSLALFRSAAVQWSDDCMATRLPQRPLATKGFPLVAMRWAVAGVLPLLLLVLAFLEFHSPNQRPTRPVAAISDDALLDQVDDQLSVAVPSSMESLTHLVSTETNQPTAPVRRSKRLVQNN